MTDEKKTDQAEEKLEEKIEEKSEEVKKNTKSLFSSLADKAKSIDYASLGEQIKTKVGGNAAVPTEDVPKRSEATKEIISKAQTAAKSNMVEVLSKEAETILEDLLGDEKPIFKFTAGAEIILTDKTLFVIKGLNADMISLSNVDALRIVPPQMRDGGAIKIVSKSGYSSTIGIGSLEVYFKMTELLKKIRQA